MSGSRTPAAERRDRLVRAPGRPPVRRAGVLLAALLALPTWAADGGVAIPVASAILFPEDAPTVPLDAGPGVFLPLDLATATAAELQAYRAAPPAPQNDASPAAKTVAIVFLVGLGVGAIAGVAFGAWAATR